MRGEFPEFSGPSVGKNGQQGKERGAAVGGKTAREIGFVDGEKK